MTDPATTAPLWLNNNANTNNNAKSTTPKALKLARIGISAAIAVGAMAVATQHAQAISALDVVNTISASGGVGVSKNILYGDQPLQDLDTIILSL